VTASKHAADLANIAAKAASDKLGRDIVALDVADHLAITDVFLIASADNERQVGAIVDNVEDALREAGQHVLRHEGERENRWVLLDFGDLVVHVQHAEDRAVYSLERIWKDCPLVPLESGDADANGSAA
jgi:ribosome-associated protein